MKKIIILLFTVTITFLGHSQAAHMLELNTGQTLESEKSFAGNILNLPANRNIVVFGGLNELDGLGAYLDVYGSKLLIDRYDIAPNGTKKITLRREDGRDFYGLYPTLVARLTPLSIQEKEDFMSE